MISCANRSVKPMAVIYKNTLKTFQSKMNSVKQRKEQDDAGYRLHGHHCKTVWHCTGGYNIENAIDDNNWRYCRSLCQKRNCKRIAGKSISFAIFIRDEFNRWFRNGDAPRVCYTHAGRRNLLPSTLRVTLTTSRWRRILMATKELVTFSRY